jgi:hypothetical protein
MEYKKRFKVYVVNPFHLIDINNGDFRLITKVKAI